MGHPGSGIWSWHTPFGPDDGSGMSVSRAQCAFVTGQRGGNDQAIVVCDIEGVADESGELQLRAVQGKCPECETPFRLTPPGVAVAVGAHGVVFQTPQGPMKFLPLTVYTPVTCSARVRAIDLGSEIGTGECAWSVVIRHGRGLPMAQVLQTLPVAIEAAQEAWRGAAQALQSRTASSGQDFSQWSRALNGVWQQAIPSMQAIQSGQYARSGPLSLVGAWDTIDSVIANCQTMAKQLRS